MSGTSADLVPQAVGFSWFFASCPGAQINHMFAANPADGSTVYHRAVEHSDDLSIIDCLLEADHSAVNEQNKAGMSPLHVASHLNRTRIVKKLLVSSRFAVFKG